MPQRRNDRLVDNFSRLLDFVHGAVEKFVGADDLQAGAVQNIAQSGIQASQLHAQDGG